MYRLSLIFLLFHLIGLAFGLGSATVKMILLFTCRRRYDNYSIFIKVTKPVTRLLITGMIFLILSGTGWLIIGYSFTTLLIIKIFLVATVFFTGSFIDKLIEPKLIKLIPAPGEEASHSFIRISKQHFALEIFATVLMYAITVIGVLL